MKSICPIHSVNYDGVTLLETPLKTQNIKVCKKCAKKLEKETKNEN